LESTDLQKIEQLEAALLRHEKSLRKTRRDLNRKQKHSSNWYKALDKMERVQRRIEGTVQQRKRLKHRLDILNNID